MRLKGKNAFITGGSQGIGFAIAESFIKEGAKVTIVGRSLEKLKKAQNNLGSSATTFPGDVSSISDLDQMYKKSYEKLGKLDILVANAGISEETPLSTTTESSFDCIISANLKGIFFTVQQALPYLNEGASIILIASLAAKQGVKKFSIYAASKAGVVSLAKSFAADLLPRKIRVNSISPGVVRTTILESAGLSEEAVKTWTKAIPMQRLAIPSEIAKVAIFLASEESSYVTAADIAVDGGVSGISPLQSSEGIKII